MKSYVKQRLGAIHSMLKDDEYVKGKVIGTKTRLSPGSVCNAIRALREQGVGILSTKNGYVLSKYAKKTDDVNFLRRLHGRRASDFVALRAAEKDIRRRWGSLEDRHALKSIIAPLEAGEGLLASGMKVLLSTTNSKQI